MFKKTIGGHPNSPLCTGRVNCLHVDTNKIVQIVKWILPNLKKEVIILSKV